MTDLHINVYAFLGMLEFALLLLVLSLVFILRSHKLARRLRVAQVKLKKAAQLPEPVSFDQYLRDELSQNQDLLERVAASQDEAEKKVADLMEIRNQYLELEFEARAVADNPIAFQDKLESGLSELREGVLSDAEIVMEPLVGPPEPTAQVEETAATEQRKLIDTRDAEFNRLKEVINNQQDAMKALLDAEGEVSPQDGDRELHGKLQELEALLEFKDATIEELEKQNSKLEARLLAAEEEKNLN
jgi:hypothetical protein